MRKTMLALTGLMLLATAALAAPKPRTTPPPMPMACSARAFLLDPAPKGIDIKAGPGESYGVLKHVPHQDEAPLLLIRGGLGNWLRISDISSSRGQLFFGGQGWLYGPSLGISTRGAGDEGKSPLYQHPDTRSPVKARLEAFTQAKILYCQGRWLKVRQGRLEGWLPPEEQCGDPVRPCR